MFDCFNFKLIISLKQENILEDDLKYIPAYIYVGYLLMGCFPALSMGLFLDT